MALYTSHNIIQVSEKPEIWKFFNYTLFFLHQLQS